MCIPLEFQIIQVIGFILSEVFHFTLLFLIHTRATRHFGSYKLLMASFSIFSILYALVEVLTQPVGKLLLFTKTKKVRQGFRLGRHNVGTQIDMRKHVFAGRSEVGRYVGRHISRYIGRHSDMHVDMSEVGM